MQYAVLVGVGISVILFVAQQSTGLVTKRMVFRDDDRVEEVDPPGDVPPNEVVVLHPYGAIFFATAPTLFDQMPTVTPESRNSVVILRIRGAEDAGATLLDVLERYAQSLRDVDSKLMLVTDNRRVIRQLRVTGTTDVIGSDNVYRSTAFIGETTKKAYVDAQEWIDEHRTPSEASSDESS
jgi:SulP family sulfate permease